MDVKKKKNFQDRNRNNKLAKQIYDDENRKYFESIQTAPQLFLDAYQQPEDKQKHCYIRPSSALVLWIVESLDIHKWVDLHLVPSNCKLPQSSMVDSSSSFNDAQSLNLLEDAISNLRLYPEDDSRGNEYVKYHSDEVLKKLKSNPSEDVEELNSCSINDEPALDFDRKQGFDTQSCKRPSIYISEKRLTVCGLSSVLRFLLKFASMKMEISLINENCHTTRLKYDHLQQLLGFRGGCLQACAEVSIWTKFCEFDIIKALVQSIQKLGNFDDDTSKSNKTTCKPESNIVEEEIPKDLLRFEYHLRMPVRIHNIRKEKQKKIKSDGNNKEGSENGSELEHDYAEGPHMLLSDLILYPCVHLFLRIYGLKMFQEHLPKTLGWFGKLDRLFRLTESGKLELDFSRLCYPKKPCDTEIKSNITFSKNAKWKLPEVANVSLYKSDSARDTPASKCFTKQKDIDEALNSVSSSGIVSFDVKQVASSVNWEEVPILAHPEGGRLPNSRRERKCQQLSSMAVEVIKVVEEKTKHSDNGSSFPLRIVDFCSGGGHVGILLAWLLPKCHIILVENKEDSLRRGRERVEQLGLTNVSMYQCNLDYFDGHFEIGVALHACGTATDLVLSKCIAAIASFVCCPCCYGAIQSNHMLHYPRSSTFLRSNVSLEHYFILAHASDQTHDEKDEKTPQGKRCMQLIDTDRCLNAQENGYKVYLAKILPETASPKNHILVGIST